MQKRIEKGCMGTGRLLALIEGLDLLHFHVGPSRRVEELVSFPIRKA